MSDYRCQHGVLVESRLAADAVRCMQCEPITGQEWQALLDAVGGLRDEVDDLNAQLFERRPIDTKAVSA